MSDPKDKKDEGLTEEEIRELQNLAGDDDADDAEGEDSDTDDEDEPGENGSENKSSDDEDDEDEDDEKMDKSLTGPGTVYDAIRQVAPDAIDGFPVLETMAKSMQQQLNAFAEIMSANQATIQNGFNQLSTNLTKSMTDLMDANDELMKSVSEQLDDMGKSSTRKSDAGGGVLQKSGPGTMDGFSQEDFSEYLNKSVRLGIMGNDQATHLELLGVSAVAPDMVDRIVSAVNAAEKNVSR